MHSSHMPLGIGGREGSWLVAWSLFLLLFLAIHVVYFMGLYVGMCVRVLCCIYVTSCNVIWVCLASTGWTSPDGFQTYCTRKLLRQVLELIITHHVTVTLFSFSFFFLFFLHRFQFWLLEMFGRWFWKEWVHALVVAHQLVPLLSSIIP